MFQKTYEILEGTTALIALFAVVGISTFSVIALNPNSAPAADAAPQGEVAGEFIDSLRDKFHLPFLINNLSTNSENFSATLVNNGEDLGYQYSANFKPSSGIINNKFIEIHNPNSTDTNLYFETEINGAVQDDLIIRAMDGKDTLVLFSPQTGVNRVKLTIPANSIRTLDIQFELLQNINFSFDVNIKLK